MQAAGGKTHLELLEAVDVEDTDDGARLRDLPDALVHLYALPPWPLLSLRGGRCGNVLGLSVRIAVPGPGCQGGVCPDQSAPSFRQELALS